jgi:hypothetical protein
VLFRLTRAVERALLALKSGRPMPKSEGVTLDEFEEVVGLAAWQEVEEQTQGG